MQYEREKQKQKNKQKQRLNKMIHTQKQRRNNKKKFTRKEKLSINEINKCTEMARNAMQVLQGEKVKHKLIIKTFEKKCSEICHQKCDFCKTVSLQLEVYPIGNNFICANCQKEKNGLQPILPIWYNENGDPQYRLPSELESLREAEKLLISLVSVYVPLHHLSMGQMGCKGHVCCFEKDISELCTVLPKLPSDVSVIRVVRKYKTEEREITTKAFSVRKHNVLAALRWLCKYNHLYKDIHIAEENLNWMGEKNEMELPGDITTEYLTENREETTDAGPAPRQNKDVTDKEEYYEECSGAIQHEMSDLNMTKENVKISSKIKNASQKAKNKTIINWPYSNQKALSEYGNERNLFCKAFPWLFPGGIGDFSQFKEKDEKFDQWVKRLLYYEDGRFAKDKIWCFYALNVANRKRNQSSGGFFVNSWYKDGQISLQQIQDDIQHGRNKWLDKITYYSKNVKGSTAYWRQKRNEVYSWINHHVSKGNGPPNFFITLSCAEYHWPDIKRLIKERFRIANLPEPDLEKKYVQIVNEYTLIVQEYFQQRVKLWLETIGKEVFKITHYWLRYEFAASRGQIHAHMLAISDHKKAFQIGYEFAAGDKRKQAQFLQEWCTKTLGFTCDIPIKKQKIDNSNSNNPAKRQFSSVKNRKKDLAECLLFFEQHVCSDYCMRKRKRTDKTEDKDSKKRRVCRSGAGVEKTIGKADTDGFPLREFPNIVHDLRNFWRLELPRKDKRTNLSSAPMLQSWRANCDCQIILYDSDFENPDLQEIAKITDYIVAYTCKGNECTQKEKEILKKYILNIKKQHTSTTDKQESAMVARMVMNRIIKEKMISKQEVMVDIAQLPLFECSETVETVSISGSYRLNEKGTKKTSFFHRYAERKDCMGMSLHEYFNYTKNQKNNMAKKVVVPYYVGGKCIPHYPPTEEYARSVFVIYIPWSQTFPHEGRDFVTEFNMLITSPNCPRDVRIPYERVKNRVVTKTQFVEPVNQHDEIDYSTFTYTIDKDTQDLLEATTTFQTEESEFDSDYTYDMGEEHDWSKPNIKIPQEMKNIENWLEEIVEKYQKTCVTESNPYGFPLRNDGSYYHIDNVNSDQKQIISYVLKHLKEWSETEYTRHVKPKTLRMTVAGVAGSGKSTMINTLVTIIRNFFKSEKCVQVCAPTGAAAFNAGGVTCHRAFGLNFNTTISEIGANTMKDLRNNMKDLVCLIVDERSMISSKVLAAMEYRARKCANNGECENCDWGNIPIVILVGDDYQLPSIDSGMTYSVEESFVTGILHQTYENKKPVIQQLGEDIFLDLAKDVMYLQESKRQQKDQAHFLELLQKARCEYGKQELNQTDAAFLCSYHLQQNHFTEKEVSELVKDPETMFLYALHADKDKCNQKMLYLDHSQENPVANIKTIAKNKFGATITVNAKHFSDDNKVLARTMICRNAKVHLYGKNVKPEWGLFNGVQGVVKDIVYKKNESPNANDFPLYVLVDFPQYKGPPCLKKYPTYVPIVPITHTCQKHCCTKTFLPLQLSYAKTIHTFQGASAGPTPLGHPENPIKRIICDPGPKDFEMRCPGLFYTLLSRATMLGTTEEKLTSAIFFTGQYMNTSRVLDLTKTKNGKNARKVYLRNLWVENLQQHSHNYNPEQNEIKDLYEYIFGSSAKTESFLQKFQST
jgi:hypothetical protein